ncbi:hypothetical protein H2198_009108 [Neophaeococcomyces mojaviensis]|uniref:Uncharacterized protein n=1 Tax=Neophaeococcomyces mojaviensis TaxID=3383035 RepID=A0ACC2ZVC9_9EURO|nr:hypothetical protein H2198_009108 [Knufia sp. JES_112]
MAAGSLDDAFESRFDLKRKRRNDDNDDTNGHEMYITKRRNLSQLPIRSPPLSRPSISVTPAFGQYGIPPGTLTPDSIPEDEELQSSNAWSQHQNPTAGLHSTFDTLDASSSDSLHLGIIRTDVATIDIDMEISSPKLLQHMTPVRIGRARSNDLMSPVRSPVQRYPVLTLFSPTHQTSSLAQQRVATPIASSFPSRSPFETSFASAAARQIRPHLLQTSLSPMVDAESWTPQIHRPPSPEPELDSAFSEDATMIGVEESHMMSNSFGALSVHSQDDADMPALDSSPARARSSQASSGSMTSMSTHGLGLDGSGGFGERQHDAHMSMNMISEQRLQQQQQHNRNMSNGGRTARLHMGYRADCEKCIARVPGHYSHIIWS